MRIKPFFDRLNSYQWLIIRKARGKVLQEKRDFRTGREPRAPGPSPPALRDSGMTLAPHYCLLWSGALTPAPPSPPAAAESSLRASPCLQGPALHTAAGGNFLEHREVAHLLCLKRHRGRPPGTPGYLLLPVHLASPLLRLLYLLLAAPGCPRHLGRLSLSLKPTFYVCHLLSEAFPTPGHEDRYVRPPRRSRHPSLNVVSPYQEHRQQHEKLTLSLPRSG